MRRLILLRHAKADPQHRGRPGDHARKLAGRGRDDAPRMGAYLAAAGIRPDLALVSDSVRTRETFELAAATFDPPIKAQFEKRLYDADPDVMLDMVRAIDDRFAVSLVVGHNPDLAHFAAWMCGGGDSVGLKAMRQKFPTSALAIIDFNGDSWAEIAPGAGKLERFVTPGMVGADGDD